MEREICITAKNGIKIHATPTSHLHGFSLSLFLRAGSMYERDAESGITHFLEHIAIRNVNAVMNGELYSLLDKHGIEFNASSFSEMVQFYVVGSCAKLAVGARLLSLLLSPIILSSAEIERERSRIKAEIRESDERTSLSGFSNKIVCEGTSLANPITGTLGSVNAITARRLEEYRKRVFTRDNVFIYATGALTDIDLALIADSFDTPLPDGEPNLNFAPVPEKFGRREPSVHIKNADFTMLRFTFDMDMSKVGVVESDLLYEILLGANSSRFYIELSENKGLFYDVSGSTERYRNIGSFVFSFEVRPDKIYEATEGVLGILTRLKSDLLLEDECMKAGYVDNALLLFDDVRELNFTMAYDNCIMGLGYDGLEERAEAYRRVSPESLRAAAREIFKPSNLTLAIKGNKRKIDAARLNALISEF